MVIGLVAAPRTAAATGGPVSPAVGPVPTPTLPFLPAVSGRELFLHHHWWCGGGWACRALPRGFEMRKGRVALRASHPKPRTRNRRDDRQPQSRQTSLARSGQPQVDCAL